ncbi:MAG: phage holin family protein [Candidatus Nanopelagicales bacterium]
MTSTDYDSNGKVDPSVRELVLTVADNATALVSAQVELAKAEMKQSAQQAGAAFGLIAFAVAVIGIGAIFLLVTLAYVLVALGLPVWAGFGIVTLLLFVAGAILLVAGKAHAKKVKGPERAQAQMEITAKTFGDTARSKIAGS